MSGGDWAPTTGAEWIARQERQARERSRGGAVRRPWFKWYKTNPFNWLASPGVTILWDSIVDGEMDGWSYDAATGRFTCLSPGTWTFYGQVGVVGGATTFTNTVWVVNGLDYEGSNGVSSTTGRTSQNTQMTKTFARDDQVWMKIFAGTLIGGAPVDGTKQMTYLTCELHSY